MNETSGLGSYRLRALSPNLSVAVSHSGDHAYLSDAEVATLAQAPEDLPVPCLAELKSKFFFGPQSLPGMGRLLASRIASKQETVLNGPSLHILVTTLSCTHSCRYCQVSRSLDEEGVSMSIEDLDAACATIFQSPSPVLTVEFQGGDPMMRFDLVQHAIERITEINQTEQRRVRFVVATSLHNLTEAHCAFFKAHEVYLSTSLDGPAVLHNKNRPIPTRDAHARTLQGIARARELIGPDAVSALMTTTRDSLAYPEAIVDEYVEQGFHEVFLRPLSLYGFAYRNAQHLGYTNEAFHAFYEQAFERVLYWNRQGIPFREVSAAIALTKMLSPFDAGFVNLQSPTGAGLAALIYNYDGYVYPSDESRMLREMGDPGLRLGRIGEPLAQLLDTPLQHDLIRSSLVQYIPECRDCAYQLFCGPDPIEAYGRFGNVAAPVTLTGHCQRQRWLFDFLFKRLHAEDPWFTDLAYSWAIPRLRCGEHHA